MRFNRAAKDWVERTYGPGSRVISSRRLHGGLSSAVHEVSVETPVGLRTVVLRRIDPAHEPDAQREIVAEERILSALDHRLVPMLLAADPSGEACGYPASQVTRLPGRPTLSPPDVGRWVSGLADAIRTVHQIAVDSSALAQLRPFRPWLPDDESPPGWSRHPRAWAEARILVTRRWPGSGVGTPTGNSSVGLVHRDLHPANVLFDSGELSGIVDWATASIGPVEVDISRCRVQVAMLVGPEAAEGLLRLCAPLCADYDPLWDAMVALEIAPWLGDIAEAVRALGTSVRVESLRRSLDATVVASL